jgi:uncharacterized membrane protein
MTTIASWTMRHYPHVAVRHVTKEHAAEWLRRGWDDLQHMRAASLAHGVLIAALGGVLLSLGSSHPYFIAAAVSGYLLIGPIMTTGACELSRRRAAGEPVGFEESLQALTRNPRGLLQLGAMLAAIAVIWFAASEVMLRSMLDVSGPGLGDVLWGGFTDTASRAQVLAYVASGAVLAAIVFTVSVVAVPLIIDQRMSATAAMWISIRATLANIPAMAVWSLLIVVLTVFGFLTLLLGMIVVAPLLGHATWHAYRDLVAEPS